MKTITENSFSQKRSPEWRFLKTLASRLHWRTKTEVFEYDNVIHDLQWALRMLCEGCYRISIGRKQLEYATCRRVYFWKRRLKKSPSPKISGYVWSCGRGLRLAKHDSARASRVLVHCKTTTSNCLISLYAKDYNFPSFLYLTWTSFIEILLQEGSPTFFTKFLGIMTTLNFQRMQSDFISDVLTTIRLV